MTVCRVCCAFGKGSRLLTSALRSRRSCGMFIILNAFCRSATTRVRYARSLAPGSPISFLQGLSKRFQLQACSEITASLPFWFLMAFSIFLCKYVSISMYIHIGMFSPYDSSVSLVSFSWLCFARNRRQIFIGTSCSLMPSGTTIHQSMLSQLRLPSSSRCFCQCN